MRCTGPSFLGPVSLLFARRITKYMPNTFVSYQTKDKAVAGIIKRILESVGCKCFLAHEDIEVSEEWRVRILEELDRADIFISLLSDNYYKSPWCVQESGIAAYRKTLTIIPLSIDGSIPQGFFSHIQSTKIPPENITIENLLPGLIKHDFMLGINIIINIIERSSSFRGAEANFRLILPYLDKIQDSQMIELLNVVRQNPQVHHAGKCASEYIPPLLRCKGHLIDKEDLEFLRGVCSDYTDGL